MYKAAIISVVCALFSVNAMAESIKLEVSPLKYMKYGLNKSFNHLLGKSQHSYLQSMPTVFTDCDSEGGLQIDYSNTYSDPKQPTKSNSITLDLSGTFVEDAALQGLKIQVSVSGTPLYQNEYVRQKKYQAGDEYKDSITWYVPGFAPDGEYEIQITLHDKSTPTPVNFACVSAKFIF